MDSFRGQRKLFRCPTSVMPSPTGVLERGTPAWCLHYCRCQGGMLWSTQTILVSPIVKYSRKCCGTYGPLFLSGRLDSPTIWCSYAVRQSAHSPHLVVIQPVFCCFDGLKNVYEGGAFFFDLWTRCNVPGFFFFFAVAIVQFYRTQATNKPWLGLVH